MTLACYGTNDTTTMSQMIRTHGTRLDHDAPMLCYQQHTDQEPNETDPVHKIRPQFPQVMVPTSQQPFAK